MNYAEKSKMKSLYRFILVPFYSNSMFSSIFRFNSSKVCLLLFLKTKNFLSSYIFEQQISSFSKRFNWLTKWKLRIYKSRTLICISGTNICMLMMSSPSPPPTMEEAEEEGNAIHKLPWSLLLIQATPWFRTRATEGPVTGDWRPSAV